jgi:hypothetical protein
MLDLHYTSADGSVVKMRYPYNESRERPGCRQAIQHLCAQEGITVVGLWDAVRRYRCIMTEGLKKQCRKMAIEALTAAGDEWVETVPYNGPGKPRDRAMQRMDTWEDSLSLDEILSEYQ